MSRFELSEKEQEDAKSFIKEHKKCRPTDMEHYTYPNYKPFEYKFIPNGIGNGTHIICPYCGEEKDITDVSCW